MIIRLARHHSFCIVGQRCIKQTVFTQIPKPLTQPWNINEFVVLKMCYPVGEWRPKSGSVFVCCEVSEFIAAVLSFLVFFSPLPSICGLHVFTEWLFLLWYLILFTFRVLIANKWRHILGYTPAFLPFIAVRLQ